MSMYRLIAIEEGGIACGAGCPYYEPSGVVRDVRGLPMKGHCRGVTEDIVVNCEKLNPRRLYKGRTLLTAKEIGKLLKMKLQKERKPYPEEHEEIHPIGWRPGNSSKKFNSSKVQENDNVSR